MTGPELNTLLFPGSNKKAKDGEKAACARHLSTLWNRETKIQDINGYLRRRSVNKDFLKGYADFKKFDIERFTKWALGPMQTKMYTESAAHTGAEGILNEPDVHYGKVDESVLKAQLKQVFQQNVSLHQQMAERGIFIIQLLDK
jgi:hypothetical protein